MPRTGAEFDRTADDLFPLDKQIIFLLVLIGSYGDVVPPLVAFQQIEHLLPNNCNIQVITHPDFESYVNDLGFAFYKISEEPIKNVFVNIPDLYSPNPLKMFRAGQKQFLNKDRHKQWILEMDALLNSFDDDVLVIPFLNSYSEIILRLLFNSYIKLSANHMVVAQEGDLEYFRSHFIPGNISSDLITKLFQKLTVNNQTRAAIEILEELGIPVKKAELEQALISNSEFLFESHVLDPELVKLIGYPIKEDEELDEDLKQLLTKQKEQGRKIVLINTGSLSQNPIEYALAIKKVSQQRRDVFFLVVSVWQGVDEAKFGDNVLIKREFTPLVPLLKSGSVDAMISNGGIGAMHLAAEFGVPVGAFVSFPDQNSMLAALNRALNGEELRYKGEKKVSIPRFSAE